eukprot:Em0010g413a
MRSRRANSIPIDSGVSHAIVPTAKTGSQARKGLRTSTRSNTSVITRNAVKFTVNRRICVPIFGERPFHCTWLSCGKSSSFWWTPTPSGWRLPHRAQQAVRFLRHVFSTHGIPDRLVSDNGTAFTSEEFKIFVKRNGIHHSTSAPYHPATNGLAERAVQTFKENLKKSCGDLETRFLFHYRTTPHTTTGVSPAELLLGRKPRTLLDNLHPDLSMNGSRSQEHQKIAHDKHSRHRLFQIGDTIYVKNCRNTPEWLPGVVSGFSELALLVKLLNGKICRRHIDHTQMDEQCRQTEALVTALTKGLDHSTPKISFPMFSPFDSTSELWTDYWARFQTFVAANAIPGNRVAQIFVTNQTKDPLDEATKTRFMCSVNNEAVLKVLFKIKDAELTFAKAISVAVETEDAAKVAKETVYGSDRSNAVFPILQDLKSDVALQEACQRVCQDFPDLFKPELRCLKDRQLEIQFKPDSKPLFCKPRVVPCHKLGEKDYARPLLGPSFLFDRPIDDDPTLEEATLKECASELKVNDKLQFEEVHSLLVTRPRKNAAETARLKMTLQIKDLEEPDSEVD